MSSEVSTLEKVGTPPPEQAAPASSSAPKIKLPQEFWNKAKAAEEARKKAAEPEAGTKESDPEPKQETELATEPVAEEKPKKGKKEEKEKADDTGTIDVEPDEIDLQLDVEDAEPDFKSRVKDLESNLAERDSRIAELEAQIQSLSAITEQTKAVADIYSVLPDSEKRLMELRLGVNEADQSELSSVNQFIQWSSIVDTMSPDDKLFHGYRFALHADDPKLSPDESMEMAHQYLDYLREELGVQRITDESLLRNRINDRALIKSFVESVKNGSAFNINPKEIAERGAKRIEESSAARKKAEQFYESGEKLILEQTKIALQEIEELKKSSVKVPMGNYLVKGGENLKSIYADAYKEVADRYEKEGIGTLFKEIVSDDKGNFNPEKLTYLYMMYGKNARFSKYMNAAQQEKLKLSLGKIKAETFKEMSEATPPKPSANSRAATPPSTKPEGRKPLPDKGWLSQAKFKPV